MRAMVEQALLVAKEALEEDDFPFPTGNAPTGPFARAVVGPHGSNAPWPKADRDGDVAVSGFAARCAAHLVWAKAKLAWMRNEKDKARHPRDYASWMGDVGSDIDAAIAHWDAPWDAYVKEEESAQGGQGGSGRQQRAGGPRAAPSPRQQQQQRQRARQHDDAARAAAAEARRRRKEREEQQRQAEEEAAREADATDDAAAARDCVKPKFPDVADKRSASREIEQMDHIPWERVLFNPFQTDEEIPRKSAFNTISNQSQLQCFSRPCASFRTSSILVASIRILGSMRVLSCSTRLQFGAVICVSHVLRCVRARGAVCRLAAVPASEAAHVRAGHLFLFF